MNGFFSENGAGRVVSAAVSVIWLGFLWIVVSLPVVTAGAASTALYYTAVKSVRRERGRPTAMFFRAFRDNFKTSSLVWLCYLAYAAVIAADFYIAGRLESARPALRILPAALCVPLALTLPWMFAYLSRFANSVGKSIRFVLFFSLQHLGRSLLLAAAAAAFGFGIWLLPAAAPFLPGIYCLLASFVIEPAFRPLTEQLGDAGAWYNE